MRIEIENIDGAWLAEVDGGGMDGRRVAIRSETFDEVIAAVRAQMADAPPPAAAASRPAPAPVVAPPPSPVVMREYEAPPRARRPLDDDSAPPTRRSEPRDDEY